MAVRVKSRHVVKPAEPTWDGILPLTELDQIGVITHTPLLYIYKKPNYSQNEVINIFKNSLSRILVSYYPFAGRLHWVGSGGRLELKCNAMGAEFIEAESTKQVSDFGNFTFCEMFEGLNPHVDYTKPIEVMPTLVVQLTWFRCGGFAIVIAVSHVVTDGNSTFQFFRDWASLARGESLETLPYLDRRILQERDDQPRQMVSNGENVDHFSHLPILIGDEDQILDERNKKTIAINVVLSKKQVDRLQKAANANRDIQHSNRRRYGRFEVIAAHTWRCSSKARGHRSDQITAMCFCVDFRNRVTPPLPPRYLGNAIVEVVASCRARELMSKPLSHVCQRIREKTDEVNNDYVCSTMNFFKAENSLLKYQDRAALGEEEGVYYGNPNLGATSLLNLPVRGLDFGWGEEVYMGLATHDFDGDIAIFPGYVNDGSVVIAVGLQVEHMGKFMKYFYEDIDIHENRSRDKTAWARL